MKPQKVIDCSNVTKFNKYNMNDNVFCAESIVFEGEIVPAN